MLIRNKNLKNISSLDKAALDYLNEKTARLSVLSNSGLVLMKFVVVFAIGGQYYSRSYSFLDGPDCSGDRCLLSPEIS